MCSYLDMVGSTYYFRRAVPQDLIGHFLTATGKPRTEWKYSLREKDRESAKRLLRPHEIETDKLIDDVRLVFQPAPALSPAELTERQRAAEEQAAQAQLDAESVARRAARSELRTLWHRRKRTSTAMLEPEEAAAVDLIRESACQSGRGSPRGSMSFSGRRALPQPCRASYMPIDHRGRRYVICFVDGHGAGLARANPNKPINGATRKPA